MLLWVALLVIVGGMNSFFASEEAIKTGLDTAKASIAKKDYAAAKSTLASIPADNTDYAEAQSLIKTIDSLSSVESLEAMKTYISTEIASIDAGFDFDKHKTSAAQTVLGASVFNLWASAIVSGQESDDKELQQLAAKLKAKVVAIQAREFPELRKAYAQEMAKLLWENNITVTSGGSGHKYINFTGGVFANNKNKQDFNNKYYEELALLRFKQSRYRWYEGEDEYTYWDLNTLKDTDVQASK